MPPIASISTTAWHEQKEIGWQKSLLVSPLHGPKWSGGSVLPFIPRIHYWRIYSAPLSAHFLGNSFGSTFRQCLLLLDRTISGIDKDNPPHVQKIAKLIRRPLILWDNYPVNDLSMQDELHIGPLQNRDRRLPQAVYGYLNNPLLQEELSLVPLATCFDYAASPATYLAEKSWNDAITQCFSNGATEHWRTIRLFCERAQKSKKTKHSLRFSRNELKALQSAWNYLQLNRKEKWAVEFKPWEKQIGERSKIMQVDCHNRSFTLDHFKIICQ